VGTVVLPHLLVLVSLELMSASVPARHHRSGQVTVRLEAKAGSSARCSSRRTLRTDSYLESTHATSKMIEKWMDQLCP
jgi:hypothetical protein